MCPAAYTSVTRSTRSPVDVMFWNQKEFKNLNQPSYPLLIWWNKEGDFCPSIPVRPGEYHIYKLHNILCPSMLENVHVIDELLSTDSTTDDFKNGLQILKGNVMTSLRKVAPKVVRNWEKLSLLTEVLGFPGRVDLRFLPLLLLLA